MSANITATDNDRGELHDSYVNEFAERGNWTESNRFQLLENGEEYFPAVFDAIAAATKEVIIETFILFDDAVGMDLHEALIAAANRGVSIDITVDGYGSPNLSTEFITSLTHAGVHFHIFDPKPPILGFRTNIFRRLHRKIVTVDGLIAFIGGINYGADHLASFGKEAKQDYAVRIEGPLALEIRHYARKQLPPRRERRPLDDAPSSRWRKRYDDWRAWGRRHTGKAAKPISNSTAFGRAQLVVRDNDRHRDDIERHYRHAIRAAKREVIIACAYFFPGYRLLRQLRRTAQRGVSVQLILQGKPDVPQARAWATMLYPSLLQAGVQIYEYCRRPLHAKVAAIDDHWATIGSSNLDPLSLALNLEANIVVHDADFNRQLRSNLQTQLRFHCKPIDASAIPRSSLWRIASNFVAYHCTRRFPRWAGWLPAHWPRLQSIGPHSGNTTLHDIRDIAARSPPGTFEIARDERGH